LLFHHFDNLWEGDLTAPTSLEIGLNLWTVRDLPPWSAGPAGDARSMLEGIAASGYRHLQFEDHDPLAQMAHAMGFECAGAARVDTAEQAFALAARHQGDGKRLTTLHLGTGLESDADACRLIEAVLNASAVQGYPMMLETHRATLTQDPWRTLGFIERFPELRFNVDLSHWYTGLELVYGDFSAKLDRFAPVFERARYMHGRIGDSGAMQVGLSPARPGRHLADFNDMWLRCFAAFLRAAEPHERIIFCAELLPASTVIRGTRVELNYARTLPGADGNETEESDRWADAQVLAAMARAAYEEVRAASQLCQPSSGN
jgi:hypothetical protein